MRGSEKENSKIALVNVNILGYVDSWGVNSKTVE